MKTPSLRPAVSGDARTVYEWRNEPAIIARSSQQKTVTWPEHQAWFEASLARPAVRRIYIIEVDGMAVGLVRFDRDPPDTGTISIYLAAGPSGSGLGVAAMRAACHRIFSEWDIDRILAHVREDNVIARKAFLKGGFVPTSPSATHPAHASFLMERIPAAVDLSWAAEDEKTRNHYDQRVRTYGTDHRSADWGSREGQRLRFSVLTAGLDLEGTRILDVGCGTGELLAWVKERQIELHYTGLDFSREMIATSQRRFPEADFALGDISSISELADRRFDHVFASGIFAYRQTEPMAFLEKAAETMFSVAGQSVTFNCLSGWADSRSPGEFHPDPLEVLALCRRITRWVTLRHDYHPGDFTIRLMRERVLS